MKVDVKDNNNFEASIKKSLTGNQYVLTIKTSNKTIDITFEDYNELKTVYDVIADELTTVYCGNNTYPTDFGGGAICINPDAIKNENDNRTIGSCVIGIGYDDKHRLPTSSHTNTSGKMHSDTKPL